MTQDQRLFLELLQVTIGVKDALSVVPTSKQWRDVYVSSIKHCVVAICLSGIDRLPQSQRPEKELLLEWIGQTQVIKSQNELVNGRIKEVTHFFNKGGYHTCLLKGQGNAQYYPHPELRQSGDIDLWVPGSRDEIVNYVRSQDVPVHNVHFVHAEADFFDDVMVEIHFQPSCMYNPLVEKKLYSFFNAQASLQASYYDKNRGYASPSVSFNLIYNLIHIYRHVFDEGIGLRQILDYYYILLNSNYEEREKLKFLLKGFNLTKFTAALMYVMKVLFSLNDDYILCKPDEKKGEQLLKDIIEGGNFGQYGKYARTTTDEQRVKRGVNNLKHDLQFFTISPDEFLCMPFFKLWHLCWRKKKGYL